MRLVTRLARFGAVTGVTVGELPMGVVLVGAEAERALGALVTLWVGPPATRCVGRNSARRAYL